jgi:hypothetical protein
MLVLALKRGFQLLTRISLVASERAASTQRVAAEQSLSELVGQVRFLYVVARPAA